VLAGLAFGLYELQWGLREEGGEDLL